MSFTHCYAGGLINITHHGEHLTAGGATFRETAGGNVTWSDTFKLHRTETENWNYPNGIQTLVFIMDDMLGVTSPMFMRFISRDSLTEDNANEQKYFRPHRPLVTEFLSAHCRPCLNYENNRLKNVGYPRKHKNLYMVMLVRIVV
jgi:hypothetical protein